MPSPPRLKTHIGYNGRRSFVHCGRLGVMLLVPDTEHDEIDQLIVEGRACILCLRGMWYQQQIARFKRGDES